VRKGRNPVQRSKIVGSKWTASRPKNREKHFLVLDWVKDADGEPTEDVEIEAVVTGRVRAIHWRELESTSDWLIGWR
jgi:tryptophan-rich hypothetical protein